MNRYVEKSALLPIEPIEGETCIVSPKTYEKASNGKLTPIESKSITIEVPQINIEFYSPDTIYVDYGSAIIRGKLTDPNQYGAKLSVNGDSISVDGEGNFSYAASFDRTGEYELEFTAKLGGHSIYRKTFKAIVTR